MLDIILILEYNKIIKGTEEIKMKKYNLSAIMKRAWELVKKMGQTISEGLKTAWAEAKKIADAKVEAKEISIKDEVMEKLQKLIDRKESATAAGYIYEIRTSDWAKYGKNRTYFKIVETRRSSKRYAEYDFGYIDNTTMAYAPGKNDAFGAFDLSGNRM